MPEKTQSEIQTESIVMELLGEYKDHRAAVKDMIKDLEKLKDNIEKLFPEKLDQRYMRLFEEKIKSTTALFNALLDMRKEVSKTIKDEIEIRRKITKDGGGTDGIIEDIENILDIRKMAKKVEKFKKTLDTPDKTIEVPKVNNLGGGE